MILNGYRLFAPKTKVLMDRAEDQYGMHNITDTVDQYALIWASSLGEAKSIFLKDIQREDHYYTFIQIRGWTVVKMMVLPEKGIEDPPENFMEIWHWKKIAQKEGWSRE